MSGQVVQCIFPTCHRTFKSYTSMLQHYDNSSSHRPSTTHPPKDAHPCKLCPRCFESKSALRDHRRAVHPTADEPPPLPVAPAVLPAPHLHIQDVACNDCGATFKNTDALHQHQWDAPDHTRVAAPGNPSYGTGFRKCSKCDAKFRSAEELEQHFVEQHPISEVSKLLHDDGTWQLVEGRFRLAWTKPTRRLNEVHGIFRVYNHGWRRKAFEEYRKELKRQMSDPKMVKEISHEELLNKIRKDGNELYRYHGTTVKCKLGRPAPKVEKEAVSLCSDRECSLCRILESGFMKDKCRLNRFQRYGKGIYCSACSSKASEYVKCTHSVKRWTNIPDWFLSCFGGMEANLKVMMVCRVLPGRPFHTTGNLTHLKAPPQGFHSVQGNPGVKLNYDELVIYNDHAILPAFIILYTSSD